MLLFLQACLQRLFLYELREDVELPIHVRHKKVVDTSYDPVTGASIISKRNEVACCERGLLLPQEPEPNIELPKENRVRSSTPSLWCVKKAMVREAFGTALVVLTAVVKVLPPALGNPTFGRFSIALSCEDLRVGEASARLQNLVVTSGLWLRTQEPATLRVLSGRECYLPGNTTFRVTSSQEGQVVAADQGNTTCTFATGTDFRLLGGEVKVSCEQDKVTAEREMSSIIEPSQGLPPSTRVHPEPRGLDFSSPGHTTELEHPLTALDTALVSERTLAETRTKNTDTNEELSTTTDITTEQMETTEASVITDAGQTTGEATDNAPSTGAIATGSPSSATTATSGNSTEPQLGSKHKSPTQNSSSQYRERSPDQVSYLVGAGAGIFILLMFIVVVVCVVRRRAPKDAPEDFFMAPTLNGSDSGLRYDGSYHNAHVMTYSGLEPEVAESFNLEDIVLKSQSYSSEYETPKCLRET